MTDATGECVEIDLREKKEDGADIGGGGEEDQDTLRFLDSMDSYLTLLDALSSTLRQGWLDMASARHSMGSSRISNTLLDFRAQSAPTVLQVSQSTAESPHFMLSKWASSGQEEASYATFEASGLESTFSTPQLRHRGSSNDREGGQSTRSPIVNSTTSDNNEQRERSKALCVFGTLVSPKLRTAQVSFETALDTIVEIANARASLLSAFSRIKKQADEAHEGC